ncbi:MAG: molybdenum cofactor biosynthesis protein MoaE [Bacteroidetes bacterium]|nr:MAG: molybdenum cofactor biosynthesis protein MoaE [Bacteroidota bacterium]
MTMTDIQISSEPLQPQPLIDFVTTESAGGLSVFIGNVRNETKGKKVLRLEFEAYEPMAISEMKKIAERVFEQFPAHKIAIHHRVGTLLPGEAAVIIAVSTPHRKAAFQACEFVIDTLKQTVPIWKKEIFEDGEVWVAAHP